MMQIDEPMSCPAGNAQILLTRTARTFALTVIIGGAVQSNWGWTFEPTAKMPLELTEMLARSEARRVTEAFREWGTDLAIARETARLEFAVRDLLDLPGRWTPDREQQLEELNAAGDAIATPSVAALRREASTPIAA